MTMIEKALLIIAAVILVGVHFTSLGNVVRRSMLARWTSRGP